MCVTKYYSFVSHIKHTRLLTNILEFRAKHTRGVYEHSRDV